MATTTINLDNPSWNRQIERVACMHVKGIPTAGKIIKKLQFVPVDQRPADEYVRAYAKAHREAWLSFM